MKFFSVNIGQILATAQLRDLFREVLARQYGLAGGKKVSSVEITRRKGVKCEGCAVLNHDAIFYHIAFDTADYKKKSIYTCGACYRRKTIMIKKLLAAEVDAIFPVASDFARQGPMTVEEKQKKGIEILGEMHGPRKDT